MDLTEFREEFLDQVRARASAGANFTHAEFVDVCAELLGDAEELADFEACYFRGTGSRNRSLGVDGYAMDDLDGSVRLVIAEYGGEPEPTTLTQTNAKACFSRLLAFCEDALSGRLHGELEDSAPGYSLALNLYERRKSVARIRLFLVTDGVLSTRVRDWPEGEVSGIPTESHIWDINRFHQVQESKTGRDELEVDFTAVVPGGLPCLHASVPSDAYGAYLCVIPGNVLAELYDRFGSRLLEGNVRSFLGARGRINKEIRKTVTLEPTMFFAYNNGIAATASAATVSADASGLRLTHVTDLQIVNGGQTTATLAGAMTDKESGLGQTFVQMKLSVLPAETSGKYIPLIARYANSQNKVSDADFFSNHDFHRRMEQIAKALRAPAAGGAQYGTHWRYERARGQYVNEQSRLTAAQRNQFLLQNPRKQLITKTDLAKYENAWRYFPHIVSQGAQKNFINFSNYASAEWEKNPDQFNEYFYKCIVVKALLFRRTEELVGKQPWYQGGYRANIVAYTVAKLANLVQFRGRGGLLDFKGLWNRQSLTPAIEQQLLLIAQRMFEIIVAPEGGFQNVTEWCKKELCWQRARDTEIILLPGLSKELTGREEEHLAKKDAQAEQSVMTGIQMEMLVVELGPAYWRALQTWARQRQLLSETEDSVVTIAAGMPKRLPNSKQCAKLLEIKTRVEGEGYQI
ncbi:MAG: AIPR protein [Bryobacterales bacterium]|nr:AIPR protein [Bryobacterales bacterium]